jgi:hypothetical protein
MMGSHRTPSWLYIVTCELQPLPRFISFIKPDRDTENGTDKG